MTVVPSAHTPGESGLPARSLKPTVFWRIGEDIPQPLKGSFTVMSVLVPFLLWWGLASTGWVDGKFLPSPGMVGTSLLNLGQEGYLLSDTLASFLRVSAGFLLASLVAIPIGIAMGAFMSVRSLLEPLIGIVRYMPAPAFIPLLIIYLGLGEEPKVALIFIGTVFFNTLMIMDAVKFVPKELIETTYTLGGDRRQVLMQVITPYVIPSIFDTLRVNMAAAWNLVIVSELVAADSGLGKRIALSQKFFQTDDIFACLIVLGLIGFVLDLSLQAIMRMTCRWAAK
ncbi:ABC transporter permease [Oscillatoria sp. CS-180]|uniref:ABC transporter permease n=1 Tax=Oscillatoria sp. CS-180 TaxID=3021720 RepID=UPI00232CDD49|nr:ABC transporter permease [Oscillatoria sp. CS-180]MDB9528704.1 ABC transporter permease [Oscillatoria sp. CS-180]